MIRSIEKDQSVEKIIVKKREYEKIGLVTKLANEEQMSIHSVSISK